MDSVGNQSFGYMDEDEKLPAYITNWYKDPFEVSIDAEDQPVGDDGSAPDKEVRP